MRRSLVICFLSLWLLGLVSDGLAQLVQNTTSGSAGAANVVYSSHYATTDLCASTTGLVDLIGGTSTTLVIDRALTCTVSKSIPATLQLQFIGQGTITITTGQTLTIGGTLTAPLVQIFSNALAGQGTVVFTGHIPGVYSEWWGSNSQGGPTFDNYPYIQAAINSIYTGHVFLVDGSYHYQTALTIPSGLYLQGKDSAGGFQTVLRPTDCAAFTIDGVHHSILENFMVWPYGTATIADTVKIGPTTYSYSIVLRDIRFHTDSSSWIPTQSVFHQTSGADILLDHVVIRNDNDQPPQNILMDASSGGLVIRGGSSETANISIKWLGGHAMISDWYTEGGGQPLYLNASGDSEASFAMVNSTIYGTNSGPPISIYDGAKNVSILSTYVWRPDLAYQGWFYGLSGSSNITIDLANYNPAAWGTSVAVPPTVVTFPHRIPPSKFTSINVTTGTLAAGDITGAKFVSLMSTNATPGTQTTRTATQMIADHLSGVSTTSYVLRITNTGAGTFTLGAGSGVTLTGTMTVAQNTWREFVVTITNTSTPAITIQSISTGTYS